MCHYHTFKFVLVFDSTSLYSLFLSVKKCPHHFCLPAFSQYILSVVGKTFITPSQSEETIKKIDTFVYTAVSSSKQELKETKPYKHH